MHMHTKHPAIVISAFSLFIAIYLSPCIAEEAAQEETHAPAKETTKQTLSREEIQTLQNEMIDLVKSGDEDAYSRIGKYALDSNPQIRRMSALALGYSQNNKEAFNLLVTLAHDESSDVRGSAVSSVGLLGNERSYDVLAGALEKDESNSVRGKATLALGKIGTEKSVNKLIACLKSDLPVVRSNAASALGRIEDKKVIDPLIAALADPDNETRRTASRSLKALTGQDTLATKTQDMSGEEAQKEWQEWWNTSKGTFAVVKKERATRPPSRSAKNWLEKYDADKDGCLNETELQTAMDEMPKGRFRGESPKDTSFKSDVTVKTTSGSETKLADLLKGTTLIYYFCSKCPYSIKAEDFIKKLYADNKDRGIHFLGISASRDTLEDMKSYLAKAKFGFPVVLDEKKEFATRNGLSGTPAVLVIDKDKKTISSYRGLADDTRSQLSHELTALAPPK
ncbi:MAG: HEAT repeat domain-containing protein [Candidatus Aureabacteria bacterium]|nr:HEAT repeat domain-containing protein [Candidatus Auribacterota bacterium]